MSDITKIVLADDHALVRDGIRSLLESENDLKVIGEASNGKEAIDLVDQGGCFVVHNKEEFNTKLKCLFTDTNTRLEKGEITKKFISKNIGATKIVLDYINSKISK